MFKWLTLIVPLTAVLAITVFFAIITVVPIEWGSFSVAPGRTITVYGTSQEKRANEIASFTAGVNEVNADKQTAVDQVNQSVDAIINDLKEFGIAEEDIKTQNISINRIDDAYNLNNPSQEVRWAANNSVEVTLREAGRASELAHLLARSGATNGYGPNFQLHNENRSETELLQSAIEDAKTKAEQLATNAGASLGEILTIDESMSQNSPIVPMFESRGLGGGGTPVEPGTSTVSRTVMVVFELR